jgi:DNA invertase Pin-like site-specific DNA recombinase
VRAALDDLGTPEALGRSPLGKLRGISQDGNVAADLRAVLVDVISELATSAQPRDAEAGKLLLDYYVKKVGSHEVIMERLHLSRPTFYRRLQRGFQLVAERLDEMSEFGEHFC